MMLIWRRHDDFAYFAELSRRWSGNRSGLRWSRLPIEPDAGAEQRISVMEVPKPIRRAAYRLLERDREREPGRTNAPPHPSDSNRGAVGLHAATRNRRRPGPFTTRSDRAMMKSFLALAALALWPASAPAQTSILGGGNGTVYNGNYPRGPEYCGIAKPIKQVRKPKTVKPK
jgi:hypothetical protein